jgi:hypothetical protein
MPVRTRGRAIRSYAAPIHKPLHRRHTAAIPHAEALPHVDSMGSVNLFYLQFSWLTLFGEPSLSKVRHACYAKHIKQLPLILRKIPEVPTSRFSLKRKLRGVNIQSLHTFLNTTLI